MTQSLTINIPVKEAKPGLSRRAMRHLEHKQHRVSRQREKQELRYAWLEKEAA